MPTFLCCKLNRDKIYFWKEYFYKLRTLKERIFHNLPALLHVGNHELKCLIPNDKS